MPTDKQGAIQAASDGGATGVLPDAEAFQFFVGPSTAAEFNTARLRIVPIACFRIDDVRFKFDSSFVLPDIQAEMTSFANLRKQSDKILDAPISIFGHADPTFQGNFELDSSTHQSGDEYNKTLSGRRAIAIYALLVRDAGLWNNLFNNRFGGDVWGEDSIRIILDRLDQQNPPNNPNQAASDSAKTSQARKLASDPGQRQQLFLKYMDALCGDLKLDKAKDFLARGAGSDQKGDVQGCSRFNPLLLFSQEDENQFKQAAEQKDEATLGVRNDDNAPNRRVMILIFRKGSQVLPAKWPCPTFKEGAAGCKKRFFSDGDTRRSTHLFGADRQFKETHDTFACRFYQRISDKSPCEHILSTFQIKLFDQEARPLPFAPFTSAHGNSIETGRADKDALLTLHDVRVPATCKVKWSRPQSGDTAASPSPDPNGTFDFELDVFVDIPPDDNSDDLALQRLHNLGYVAGPNQEDDVADFQHDYRSQLPADTLKNSIGKLDDPTKNVLRQFHNSANPLLKAQDDVT